jgi:hypothetical protein
MNLTAQPRGFPATRFDHGSLLRRAFDIARRARAADPASERGECSRSCQAPDGPPPASAEKSAAPARPARGGRVSAPAQAPPAVKASIVILEWHRLSHGTSVDAWPSRNCCTFGDALALQSFQQTGPRPRRWPREPRAKLRWRLRILQGMPTFLHTPRRFVIDVGIGRKKGRRLGAAPDRAGRIPESKSPRGSG